MVDKTGKLVSFEELQTDIDAALEVRRNRKESYPDEEKQRN